MTTPANKGMKLPPEPLTLSEVESILRQCSDHAPTGVRNRALIVLLWRGQLRVSEALALMPRDLDADAGTVRVRHGKGDKCRVIGLDAGAWAVVARWLDTRKALRLSGRNPVLCTLAGEPMEAAYVRALLPRLARKAGVEKRVHAHGLRHSGAFELANEGHPIHVIQQQLGHSSLATTDRYIRHLNPRQVVETMQRRKWGGLK